MSPTKRYRCVPLFGPPGVGKGTQGRILAEIPGFFHLSVGDVFRSIDIGSRDGREVYDHISRGELVPDELTIKIWRKTVEAYVALSRFKPREDLLILDGMPRNVHQVEIVQEYLEIHRIIFMNCSDEEDMIHRIRRRAIRDNRTDDANEDVIRHRFEIYRRITAPVLKQYDPAIIHEVDANGSPAEVLSSILGCLIPVQNELFEANRREDEAHQKASPIVG
ncbi:MAG: nucleoside monophosphate kinase [Planctomycetaceae bacterium]|nr:nucleoside monophosphate kinase [Planctomycetaceae bacterium]